MWYNKRKLSSDFKFVFWYFLEVKMRMGFAETDVTPEVSVEMVGFNRTDNMSRGILDCLTARAIEKFKEHK